MKGNCDPAERCHPYYPLAFATMGLPSTGDPRKLCGFAGRSAVYAEEPTLRMVEMLNRRELEGEFAATAGGEGGVDGEVALGAGG